MKLKKILRKNFKIKTCFKLESALQEKLKKKYIYSTNSRGGHLLLRIAVLKFVKHIRNRIYSEKSLKNYELCKHMKDTRDTSILWPVLFA